MFESQSEHKNADHAGKRIYDPALRKGYLYLFRKFFDGKYWKEERKFSRAEALLYLIAFANGVEKIIMFDGKPFLIKRGQLVTSINKLSKIFGRHKQTVASWLKQFVEDKTIQVESDNKKTVITLLKYKYYQNPSEIYNSSYAPSYAPSYAQPFAKPSTEKQGEAIENKDNYKDTKKNDSPTELKGNSPTEPSADSPQLRKNKKDKEILMSSLRGSDKQSRGTETKIVAKELKTTAKQSDLSLAEKKLKTDFTPEHRELTELLASTIKSNPANSKVKTPATEAEWYHSTDSIRLLATRDGNSLEDIKLAIKWLPTAPQNGNFCWWRVIQSSQGFRKHFPKLWSSMSEDPNSELSRRQTQTDFDRLQREAMKT